MGTALLERDGATPVASEPDAGRSLRRKPGRRWGHKVLLSAHVLASVGWFGVAVTVALCGIMAGSNDDIAYYEIIQSTLWLTVPLGLTAAATGVALSLTTRWGLVRHWWVVAKRPSPPTCSSWRPRSPGRSTPAPPA
jgi:hypothetical protein